MLWLLSFFCCIFYSFSYYFKWIPIISCIMIHIYPPISSRCCVHLIYFHWLTTTFQIYISVVFKLHVQWSLSLVNLYSIKKFSEQTRGRQKKANISPSIRIFPIFFLLLALFSWFLVIYCYSHLCSWTTYRVLAVTDCFYTFQQYYVFSIFIRFFVTNHLLRHCTAVIKKIKWLLKKLYGMWYTFRTLAKLHCQVCLNVYGHITIMLKHP